MQTFSTLEALRNSSSRITRSLFLKPMTAWTSAPQSWNFFSTGYAMAQPTPPPTTQTFFLPSVSVALPRGPTKSCRQSPSFRWLQLLRGGAHGLDDDGDGALLRVIVVDGDGDPLAVLIHAQDDELARLGLLGDQGCLDLVQGNGGTERLFSHDTIHTCSFFPE